MLCKLCEKNSDLVRSHIIPEFIYTPLYDEKHRFQEHSNNTKKSFRYLQKGIREKILCTGCDRDKLGKFENYTAKIFKGGVDLNITDTGASFIVKDINYKFFKLFQLTNLWRMSISKLSAFNSVNLGIHEKKIHDMLISETPGTYLDYGCVTIILYDKNILIKDLIVIPERLKHNGFNVYRVIFGGLLWIYYVNSHNNLFKYKNLFLQENGIWTINKIRLKDVGYFKELIKEFL